MIYQAPIFVKMISVHPFSDKVPPPIFRGMFLERGVRINALYIKAPIENLDKRHPIL